MTCIIQFLNHCSPLRLRPLAFIMFQRLSWYKLLPLFGILHVPILPFVSVHLSSLVFGGTLGIFFTIPSLCFMLLLLFPLMLFILLGPFRLKVYLLTLIYKSSTLFSAVLSHVGIGHSPHLEVFLRGRGRERNLLMCYVCIWSFCICCWERQMFLGKALMFFVMFILYGLCF